MLCFGDRVILYCSKGRWCLCVSGQSTWLDSTNSHACSGHGSSVSCRFRLFKHRTWGFFSLVLFFLEFPTTLLPSWLPWAPFPGSFSSSNQRDVRLSVAVVAAPVPLWWWLHPPSGQNCTKWELSMCDCLLQVMIPAPKCVFQSSEPLDSFFVLGS